jgi:PAS domain S-box-containing protein
MVSRSMTQPNAIGVERFDVRVGLVALSAAFYALTFLPLYELLGPGVVSLSSVPVALAGWLFGLRAGMLAGAIAFPVNTVLLGVEEAAELNSVIWGGAVAGSAALLVGSVAGTLRDVTDRLQGELEKKLDGEGNLLESEERLRHLVENAPGMLVTVAVDGTIIYANRAIGGLSQTQLRGTNVYSFVPRSHQTLFRKTLEKVFTSGEQGGYEIADPPEVGAPTLHIIRFGPVVEDDQVVAATLLSLDVTDTVG